MILKTKFNKYKIKQPYLKIDLNKLKEMLHYKIIIEGFYKVKMGRLLNFIIIDEFKCRRMGSIYFLTHWHSGTPLLT